MPWTFLQAGKLITPMGHPSAHTWYSGFSSGRNNPAAEGLVDIGPIPCGTWTLATLIDTPTAMGPIAIHLIPDQATRDRVFGLGRHPDSFYIHDGRIDGQLTASRGCLVCVEGTVGVRSMWDSGDRTLIVKSGLET